MRVADSLGQVRVAGKIYNFYSNVSRRPYPFKSEDDLIDEGIETDLIPPWGEIPAGDGKPAVPAYTWPDYVSPPAVPSLEEEVYAIRRGDTRTRYPWAGTWNDNRISTKELNKTTYPKSPAMAGLGQGRSDAPVFVALGAGAILLAPVLGVIAYAAFRAIGKEDKPIFKVALGVGGVMFGLNALSALAVGVGGLTAGAIAASRG